ncbi:MAG: SURF1 family protein [Chloroflexi bacterium]|nr:MAG: SURF1 family protein [Chloroflexota bacterium]
MGRLRMVLRALVSRRYRWATLAVVLGMGLLARLGFWQLDRLAQRRAANAVLAESLNASPVNLADVVWEGDVAVWENRLAFVEGEYDLAHQMVLLVQNWQGRAGVHLIAPLVLGDGETAVLVDRGWIPESERDNISQFDLSGPVTVNGYIALSQTISRNTNQSVSNQFQPEWYRVDIAAIEATLPYKLLPVYLVESPSADGNTTLPFRSERVIDLSEGPHLSYAIQWFLFSLLLGGMYIGYVNSHLPPEIEEKQAS